MFFTPGAGAPGFGWRHRLTVLLLVLLFLLSCLPAASQAVYGTIFGTVSDTTGAAVENATVTATSVDRGTKSVGNSNKTGSYELTHLLPGEYNVRVEMAKFKTSEMTGVAVHVDGGTRLDVQMHLGNVSESITVSASTMPLLRTDRVDVSATFDDAPGDRNLRRPSRQSTQVTGLLRFTLLNTFAIQMCISSVLRSLKKKLFLTSMSVSQNPGPIRESRRMAARS